MIYIATDNFNDGFPLSNAYDDTIYQKANGEYYLKFRFPVDRLGVWKHLTCETVLKADDTRGLQLFKIKKINKINGYIRVYAKHISDDLNFIAVDKIAVSNATGRRVMEALAGSTTEQHSFIFDSDIATMHTLNLSNTTAGKVLSKDKHSIIGQWGGELIRDNFLIDLKARAGVDTEILFMNKKNVKNLDNVVSTENLTTRLKLTVEKEHEGKKQIITATVDSPNINAYPRIYTNYLKVNNNNIETQQQLIEYGNKYFKDSLVDFPTDNLTVNVIDKNQEQINLFDTVWFRNVDFNIDKRLKVVAYEYSPMAKRYKKISFGALKVASLGQIKSLSQLEDKIEEKVNESFVDTFKIQKNLSELLKSDRKGIEDKLVELEEKSKGALEVKKALFEADGTIPDVVKTKILDAVEGDIGRLKTIITEAELIKAIQAKLNYAEIKNALIDKVFINQIISDEKFTQQFEDGEVTTQNIFTKLKDSIKSNISKEFMTKEGVKKLVNDLTIDADGIRQITQQESVKVFENKKQELKGVNAYLHKKYSDFEDGRNMSDNSTLKYIGIYTGDKEQAPTNASEYSWTKIKGEDGKSINENLLPNSNFNQGFTNWEDKLTNSGLNYNFDHAITHFGRGLHIYGTANAEYKGFSSVPFNLIAKQGDKLTLSMDLGKDALTQNAPLKLALHYIDDKDIIVRQEWQTLDLATQNFEVKKYKRISRVFTVGKDIRKCRVMIYATNGQLIDFYIDNIKLERGEVATEWTPAYEDLQAHSLTANLRFEGRYVNNIVTDLTTFVDVFYDGQKITEGFELKVKHKGMGASNWTDFISRPYDNTGRLTNFIFSNGEKDGTPLEAIVLVTYKGLNTITNERIENVPDVTEIKETVKKYKILESTLDRFNSTIGQVKEQVVNGNRNYITNSGSLNDKSFGSWNKWEKSIQNGTIVFTKINGSDNVGFFINFTELVKTEFQNETMTWSIDVRASRNCTFNRIGFETNGQRSFNLTTQWQRISHTFVNKFTNYFAFTFYNPTSNFNNGDKIYIRFPKLEKGNVATEWTVAPEDVSLLKETTETSIEQTNRNLELKVSKDNVIASINASVEKNAQGQNQGIVKIKGEVLADNIHGKTFTGSKFEVGKSGILDSQGNNLRISAPHDWNGSSGVGMQLRGKTEGDFNQGLNIYRVNDVRNPNTPLYTPDETALTVFGEIRGAFKINSAPRSGKILSRMGRVVMSNISSNNPVKPDGYSGQLLQITGIFLKYGGGPTQLWVNDGTGSNSTFGVNLTNMESDIKLKENISISNHSGLEVIEKFTFHSFDWKEDKLGYRKPHTKIGLIAQEVQEIQEDLVYKNPNALALDEFRLLNISLKAIQELSTENQQLKSQLNEMNERLQKLEDKINGNL